MKATTKNLKYYIESVSDSGITYFQVVRRKDEAILFANRSLSLVADRLYNPRYKDGSEVIL
jgi:hypothetical protein